MLYFWWRLGVVLLMMFRTCFSYEISWVNNNHLCTHSCNLLSFGPICRSIPENTSAVQGHYFFLAQGTNLYWDITVLVLTRERKM